MAELLPAVELLLEVELELVAEIVAVELGLVELKPELAELELTELGLELELAALGLELVAGLEPELEPVELDFQGAPAWLESDTLGPH